MGIQSSGCEAVDAMSKMVITGNVIPPRWYKAIRKENGRSDYLAVNILSDIVYWYRPVEIRDERTGYVVGLRKKFKGDLLQKTYEEYGKFFDEKKRVIKEAMDRLEKMGLIRRVFRGVVLESGRTIPNVMYIEIFPDRIREITREDIETSGPTVQKSGENDPEANDHCLQSVDSAGSTGHGTDSHMISYENPYHTLQKTVPYPPQEDTHTLQGTVPYPPQDDTHLVRNSEGYPPPQRKTNTERTAEITRESTTENTTENSTENTQTEFGQSSPVNPVMSRQVVDNSDDEERLAQVDGTRPIRIKLKAPPSLLQTETRQGRPKTKSEFVQMLREQVRYECLRQEPPYCHMMETVDGFINFIADIATTKPVDGYEIVNKRKCPHDEVKNRLLEMHYDAIKYALDRFRETTSNIRSLRSYALTTLYNALDEVDLRATIDVNRDMYGGGWQGKGVI